MRFARAMSAAVAAALGCAPAFTPSALAAQAARPHPRSGAAGSAAAAGVERFNQALADATRHMDNGATLALWADDGISLLPGAEPIVGKPAITKFLEGVTARMSGAHMKSYEQHCFGLEVSGAWASEWCTEHQVVDLGGGKTFDGRGKMLFVLHREVDSVWRVKREMWNRAAEPKAGAS
ncbi:MAG TPA: nuclear transport factor 2 family protein [Gemmatimonadales bacterium]|nr:nuclear transport factor 2 family protein [Gemmatimonadales bacterium]